MSVPSAHGQLTSFGSSNLPAVAGDRLTFSGSGSLSADPDNTVAVQVFEPVDTIEQLTGQTFGVTLSGTSARPQKDNSLTFQYWLTVPDGTAEGDVWPAMQAMSDALWAWYFGTYDYANADGTKTYSGASGMAGDLVVEDAAGVAQVCAADFDKFGMQLVPGEPDHYGMPVAFTQVAIPQTSGGGGGGGGGFSPQPPAVMVRTAVGTGVAGSPPFPSSVAPLSFDADIAPAGASVCYDSAGALYFTVSHEVYQLNAAGTLVTLYAGNTADTNGYSGDGGPAVGAELDLPQGMCVDGSDNLYVADENNNVIRMVAHATGHISTYNTLPMGVFNPTGICFDSTGALLVACRASNQVYKIPPGGGTPTLAAGDGTYGDSGDGGAATSASVGQPFTVACDASDNIFIGQLVDNVVRRVDHATGFISTVAGGGSSLSDGVAATTAKLGNPSIIIRAGLLYLTIAAVSPDDCRVRVVDVGTGIITTVAGNGAYGYAGDGGPPLLAEFNGWDGAPAFSPSGVMALSDSGNNVIRVVTGL